MAAAGKPKKKQRENAEVAPFGGFWVPLLFVLVLVSALALIQSSHKSRKLFSEL